jgi:serine/threonine-protein kinase
LPLEEALSIAKQIAEALEAAHEHSIIHRDLKPANIKLRPDGTVKVLDFGLAKIMEDVGRVLPSGPAGVAGSKEQDPAYVLSQSPTITSPAATRMGVILGTAAYMSPEQARGKAVDKRTDIWAFGSVLYEMLTGKRAFPGEDVTDTLAAIVRGEPDWEALPANVPPTLRVYLRRCLQKNPRDRVHDIADMRLAFEGAFDLPAAPADVRSVADAKKSWQSLAVPVTAALILIFLSGVTTWVLKPTPAERPGPIRRFAVTAAPAALAIANTNRDLAITPDGTRIVYFAGNGSSRQLYVRSLDALDGTAIREAEFFFEPFVSPDGKWIGFNDEADYTLRKISVAGGPAVSIAPVGREILGATWGPDDSIVFATTEGGTGLWRVAAGGGKPVALTKPDKERGEISHAWPEFLPGGKALLYTIRSSDASQVAALNLETGEQKVLLPVGTSPRFSPTGHLVYGVETTLRAVRFDPTRLEVLSDPIPVLESVAAKPSGGVDFSVAGDGTLVYVGGSNLIQRRLVWVDRRGSAQPLKAPLRRYQTLQISPDGARVALDVRDEKMTSGSGISPARR